MTGREALLMVALLLTAGTGSGRAFLLPNETECPSEALVDLTDYFGPGENGSVTVNGTHYPADAISWPRGRPLGCPCRTQSCLPLCCSALRGCVKPINGSADFLPIYSEKNGRVDESASVEDFWQFAWNPCHGGDRYALEPESTDPVNKDDGFQLLANGSLYQPTYDSMRNYTNFCVDDVNGTYRVMLCFDDPEIVMPAIEGIHVIFPVGMLISVPFLLATFIVYMLIPELRNIHGQTLCAYVLALVVAYVALSTLQIIRQDSISDFWCSFYGTR